MESSIVILPRQKHMISDMDIVDRRSYERLRHSEQFDYKIESRFAIT
jgi:hypothetical protein